MSDIKTITVRADIILQMVSELVVSKKRELDMVLEIERKLNDLPVFEFDDSRTRVGIRVHVHATGRSTRRSSHIREND